MKLFSFHFFFFGFWETSTSCKEVDLQTKRAFFVGFLFGVKRELLC